MERPPYDFARLHRECQEILRNPVYSPQLSAKLIGWLQTPQAAISNNGALCLIALGPRAFDDLYALVIEIGPTNCPHAVRVLSSCEERYEQVIPLLRDWLAGSNGDTEAYQYAISLASILEERRAAGIAPDRSDVAACRRVIERQENDSLLSQRRLARLSELFAYDSPVTPPRRWSFKLRTLLVPIGLLGLALGCLIVFLSVVKASYIYEVAAEFEAMPADDLEIDAWLREEPGVVAHTVNVRREGAKLVVIFMQSKDLRGQPPFPDLETKCKEAGYVGDHSRFRDIVR